MTHVELFKLLEAGHRLRQTHWSASNWIELKDGFIVEEDGRYHTLCSYSTYKIYCKFDTNMRSIHTWNEFKLEVIANKAWKNGQLKELAEAAEPDQSLIEESFLRKKGMI